MSAEEQTTSIEDKSGESSGPQALEAKEVVYCAVCTFPVEYCEFGSSLSKCKDWLKSEHPTLFDQYYSDKALQAKIGTLSLEKQSKLEEDVAKAEKKAAAKADAAEKKKMGSKVQIKRMQRNKNKYVTEILGLEAFGLDLKKTAKACGKTFATGASQTKNSQGQDIISIQGDVADDIMEMISDGKDFWKEAPEDNVEIVEDRKKKGAD